MAAYLNRTISMITGGGGGGGDGDDNNSTGDAVNTSDVTDFTSKTGGGGGGGPLTPAAGLLSDGGIRLPSANMAGNKSPLQIFVKAKKKINDIYVGIADYVLTTSEFVNVLHNEANIVDKAEYELFQSYVFKVASIREVLARDHMKVAFFGRTSNGKSTVINAMLREKILPSGIGHTTNCFCQVEGSDSSEAYLIKEGSNEKLNVTNIKQLANALCQEKLSESSLVRIFWPRQRCNLLRDDVVFVDSPGVDVSANLDDWIDNHCLNADVFVLVLNAESTMTRAEKQFFHTVSQKLSKPNIFILNNRWDASAHEPESQDSVKSQHTERCIDFLTKELKITNEREAAERVFFVSAREALQGRIEEAKGNLPSQGAIADGFQMRYFEFQDFERKFEECISKSAVQTKFEKHSSRGKSLSNDMSKMLEDIHERVSMVRDLKLEQKNSLVERIQNTEVELKSVTDEMKQKIRNMVSEVEQKVSKALNEEIWRLGVLIDEFQMPFHTQPVVLNIYKAELNKHMEAGLGSNLRARLSMALAMNVETIQCDMTERMQNLVDCESFNDHGKMVMRSQPFEMLYLLNCQNLCNDFQEDLEFKFSWGMSAMINRFTGKVKDRQRKRNNGNTAAAISITNTNSNNPTLLNQQQQQQQQQTNIVQLSSPVTPARETAPVNIGGISQDQLSMISKLAISSIGSQGTVGSLLVAGIMLKTIGWRVLVGVGALYGCIYLYERLSWTNSAKERAFKAQYVRHATKKLRMIVDFTSANCSQQVQYELSSTFANLYGSVERAKGAMSNELKVLDTELQNLENNQQQLKLLRNKAIYIHNELDIFERNYIKGN